MSVKLNSAENYEPIEIKLTKRITPIAYRNKIEEMVEQGCYETIEEAEKDNPIFVMECEIYYDKHSGLFGGKKNLYYLCIVEITYKTQML